MDQFPASDSVSTAITEPGLPETWARRRSQEIMDVAQRMLSDALASAFISAAQRATAEQRSQQSNNIHQVLSWQAAVTRYVQALALGHRQPVAHRTVQALGRTLLARRAARRLTPSKLARRARRQQQPAIDALAPMWSPASSLSVLPGGLHWSGRGAVPGIDNPLQISRPCSLSGSAKVKGYFHAEGFLGLVVEFEKVPARHSKAVRSQFIFGSDLSQAA